MFRTLTAEEYARLYIHFHNLTFQFSKLSSEDFVHIANECKDMDSKGFKFYAIEMGSEIVGLISIGPLPLGRPHSCRINITSPPPGEKLAMILDSLFSLCENPHFLIPSSLAFLINEFEKKGFKVCGNFIKMALELKHFNFEPFKSLILRLENEGFRFRNFKEAQLHTDELVSLINETTIDEPSVTGRWTVDIKSFKAQKPLLIDDSCYAALHGSQLIAITLVMDVPGGDVYFHYTGVKRDYRRIGIATAIKALALRRLVEKGFRRALTWNNKNNIAIVKVNERLGFRVIEEYFDYSSIC